MKIYLSESGFEAVRIEALLYFAVSDGESGALGFEIRDYRHLETVLSGEPALIVNGTLSSSARVPKATLKVRVAARCRLGLFGFKI